ncbi:MAG TPA: amino acid permease [Myxococcales bacterium]|nr:amino acid permease [Myxococcales bacterium]
MPGERLAHRIGVFDATMVVMGGIVGSGIFVTPAIVAAWTATRAQMLGAWVVGGAAALIGAFVYADLSRQRPFAGGQYVYLRDAYHPAIAFLYGWALLLVIQTGGMAVCAMTFARYLRNLAGLPVAEGALAALALAVLTAVNCLGVSAGAKVQSALMVLKIAAIAALIGCGLWLGAPVADAGHAVPASFGAALIPVLFSYGGFQTACFVAEELREPRRDLPRALVLGVLAVVVLYVGVAVSCVRVLGMDNLRRSAAPALDAAMLALGPRGAALIAAGIAISSLGFLSQSILTAPRVYFAMADDGLFFRSVARVGARSRAPAVAIALQGALAALLSLWGTYEELLRYVVAMDFIFFALTAGCLFVFRARGEPCRMPGHPLTTLSFIGICAVVVISTFVHDPARGLIGLALTLAGLPVYLLWRGRNT